MVGLGLSAMDWEGKSERFETDTFTKYFVFSPYLEKAKIPSKLFTWLI